MKIVDPTSLGATLDNLNEALFFGRKLPQAEKLAVARWLAARQGRAGSYAGMFAITERDAAEGVTVFTGERVRTGAATRHILGEEACRAMRLLGAKSAGAREAMSRAAEEMELRLASLERNQGHAAGTYCCGICSCAYWRNLLAGGLSHAKERLAAGLPVLRESRLGNGRWRRFPLHYTLLALVEMDGRGAIEEMQYAAPALERSLRRAAKDDKYAVRRRALTERVLAKC